MPSLRLALRVLAGVALGAAGCTPDESGTPTCTDGTRLNPTTNACELDPNACQSGTVLVNGQCIDPTNGLTIDLEEGPEPNGLAGYDYVQDVMLEANVAGAIALKPIGSSVVIHGCISPVDGKPDYDAYTLTVSAPTLIDVTVDGVGGLTPGFFVDLDLWPAVGEFYDNYRRSAATLANDTSQRELFLPIAGTYKLFIADTRSMLWNSPFGNPDRSTCYYASVAQRTPAPTPLDLGAGATGTFDGKVKLYTVPYSDQFIHITTTANTPDTLSPKSRGDRAPRMMLLGRKGEFRQFTRPNLVDPNSGTVELRFGNADSAVLVVDADHQFASEALAFTLTAEQYGNLQPLPKAGATMSATVNATRGFLPLPTEQCIARGSSCTYGGEACCYDPNYLGYSYFYYDVTTDHEFTGMKLAFSIPVQGSVYTQDNEWLAGFGGEYGTRTFTDFAGIVRATKPGRYYFWLYAPNSTLGDPFTVTSSYRALTPTPLASQGATGSIAVDPVFGSNIFSYDPTTPAWQQLNATGTNMGEVVVTRYHSSVFGRLDGLTTTDETGQTVVDQGSPRYPEYGLYSPGVSILPQDGSRPISEVSFGFPTPLYLKVRASTPTASSRFDLGLASRPSAHSLGTLAAGTTTALTNQTITATPPTDLQRYFFSTAPGNLVTITVTPTRAFDAVIATLARDETDRAIYNTTTSGPEVAKFRQDLTGGTAFVVRSTAATQGAYDITIKVESPYYRVVNSSTVFQDACIGGAPVELIPDGTLDSFGNIRAGNNDGLSASIATPSGFRFYGGLVSALIVSSNGFFSFDTRIRNSISSPVTCEFANNQMVCTRVAVPGVYEPPPNLVAASLAGTMPDGVGAAHVAPYWYNLKNIVVCQKASGSRLTIQWTGETVSLFDELGTGGAGGSVAPGIPPLQLDVNRRIQMQAILDASDQSIEFVYGPKTFVRSDTGGTGGVQDLTGFDGTQSFDSNQPPFPSGTLPKAMTSVKFVHP